mmetsp:Transcript_91421/g.175305  ORF Transcript_91421/g.175305 Transcript_91421/m.175305 type:complete len:863 (+) Transcript_91421:16-2604(+)
MASKAAAGSQNLPDLTPRNPQPTSKSLPEQSGKSRRHSFSKVPTRSALALRRTLAETSRCTRLPALDKADPPPNSDKHAEEHTQPQDVSQSARRKHPDGAGVAFGAANFHRPWLDEVKDVRPPPAPPVADPAPPTEEPTKRGNVRSRRPSFVPAASAETRAALSNVIAECTPRARSSVDAGGERKLDPLCSSTSELKGLEAKQESASCGSNASTVDTAGPLGEHIRNSSKQSQGHAQLPPPVETANARRYSLASSASIQSASNSPEVAEEAGSPRAAHRAWHVMLLDRTFNDRSVGDVIKILTQVLGVSEKAAAHKLSDATKHRVLELATFPNQHEAFQTSEQLRDRGLLVQIVSDSGLPGAQAGADDKAGGEDASSAPQRLSETLGRQATNILAAQGRAARRASHGAEKQNNQRRNSYNELFQEILPGQAHKDPKRLAKPPNRRASVPALSGGHLMPVALAPKKKEAQDQAMPQGSPSTECASKPEITSTPFSNIVRRGSFKALVRKASQISRENTLEPKMEHEDGSGNGSQHQSAGMELWDVVLDELQISPSHGNQVHIDKPQREACLMMRLFVFGHLGSSEQLTPLERETMIREPIGTKQQVHSLHLLWTHLDEDNSGRVDMQEFRKGAELSMRQKFRKRGGELPGLLLPEELAEQLGNLQTDRKARTKFISRVCDRCGGLLLGKKSSFAMQDMMRLMWPCAKADSIKVMTGWCHDFVQESKKHRVETPPVLDQEQFEDLCSIFKHYDAKGSGEIHFDHLVTVGLIYEDQIDKWREDWDADGNGLLDMTEFCDMMCPAGFRATKDSLVGSQKDGRRVRFDHWIDGWREELLESIFLDESALMERQCSQESLLDTSFSKL